MYWRQPNACYFAILALIVSAAIVLVSTAFTVRAHDDKNQIEALKALADWSKWLISINVALSAIALYRERFYRAKTAWVFQWAAGFFILSVISAGVLLGAIPNVMEDLGGLDCQSIYEYGQFCEFYCIPIKVLAGLEHGLFVVGLLFVLCAVLAGPSDRGASGSEAAVADVPATPRR